MTREVVWERLISLVNKHNRIGQGQDWSCWSENDWTESFFLSLCCIIIILFYNPCNRHQFDARSSLTCTLDLLCLNRGGDCELQIASKVQGYWLSFCFMSFYLEHDIGIKGTEKGRDSWKESGAETRLMAYSLRVQRTVHVRTYLTFVRSFSFFLWRICSLFLLCSFLAILA